MNRIIQGLNRIFHGNRRQMFTAGAAAFVVYVLLLTGIFSYFHSEDTVSNRLTAPQGSVTIAEPQWDSEGQYMAKAAEPGMQIKKDPSGVNNGSVDEYIRLVMTVETVSEEYYSSNCTLPDTADTANGEIAKKSAEERLDAIVNAIQYINDSNTAVPLLTENDGRLVCANGNFVVYEAEQQPDENKRTYYFYYTAGDKDSSDEPLMRLVKPNQATHELFQRVDLPIYKKDYLGVFDFDYNITMTAEAIPVGDNTVQTVSDAVAKFES